MRRPARVLVSGQVAVPRSDREFPASTEGSGTQRARHPRSCIMVDTSAPWSSSPPSDLHITSVFPCVARGFKPRASFMFTGCCWRRPLAVDGGSGTSGGHAWSAPVMRGPGADFHVAACTLQGMARVRSGQAPAWPLVSDRSGRRGSGVKHDFACTFAGDLPPCLCPAVTVMLEVGGADTYAQRAIPGSGLRLCWLVFCSMVSGPLQLAWRNGDQPVHQTCDGGLSYDIRPSGG